MISGWRYVSTDSIQSRGCQSLNRSGSFLLYSLVLIDTKPVYVITARETHAHRISELVKFKFDYDISKPSHLYFVWSSFQANCNKISVCDDIEKDSARFYHLSEYLLKGVK